VHGSNGNQLPAPLFSSVLNEAGATDPGNVCAHQRLAAVIGHCDRNDLDRLLVGVSSDGLGPGKVNLSVVAHQDKVGHDS
jgi:hypothetical protein